MTQKSYRTKKCVYGDEISHPYSALDGVECDFEKETFKVSSIKWTLF